LHFGGSGIVDSLDNKQVPVMMLEDNELLAGFSKILIGAKCKEGDDSTGTSCDPAGQYPQLSPTVEDLVTSWTLQIVGADATADL
jgi:hypothetical protein